MTQESIQNDRNALRAELRQRRKALSPTQQAAASAWVLRHLSKLPPFMRAQHVALYLANDGEIDPLPIAQQLWKMGKHCYLPVVHPTQPRQLWFVPFTPDSQLTPNRFGIPEPDHRAAFPHVGRRLKGGLGQYRQGYTECRGQTGSGSG